MAMMMIDQYILTGFIASLFGFVLLYSFTRKVKKTKGPKTPRADDDQLFSNQVIRPVNADADIIIVGAGVAGAALAFTLGKVSIFFRFNALANL